MVKNVFDVCTGIVLTDKRREAKLLVYSNAMYNRRSELIAIILVSALAAFFSLLLPVEARAETKPDLRERCASSASFSRGTEAMLAGAITIEGSWLRPDFSGELHIAAPTEIAIKLHDVEVSEAIEIIRSKLKKEVNLRVERGYGNSAEYIFFWSTVDTPIRIDLGRTKLGSLIMKPADGVQRTVRSEQIVGYSKSSGSGSTVNTCVLYSVDRKSH